MQKNEPHVTLKSRGWGFESGRATRSAALLDWNDNLVFCIIITDFTFFLDGFDHFDPFELAVFQGFWTGWTSWTWGGWRQCFIWRQDWYLMDHQWSCLIIWIGVTGALFIFLFTLHCHILVLFKIAARWRLWILWVFRSTKFRIRVFSGLYFRQQNSVSSFDTFVFFQTWSDFLMQKVAASW